MKVVYENYWFRILRYGIVWLACIAVAIIPLLIFYPSALIDSGYKILLDTDLFFISLTQICSLFGTLCATYIVVKRIEKRNLSEIKLTINIKTLLWGFILGTCVMALFILAMIATHSIRFSYSGLTWDLILTLFLFLAVAISEEVIVRGYILNTLREYLGARNSILLSAFIFSSLHLFNDHFNLIGFINIFLSGILMGILCVRMNTLSPAIGIHWAWNYLQGPVAGFSVSGQIIKGIFHVEPYSSSIITGGPFGAEGSVVLVPIILIFIYWIYKRVNILYFIFFKTIE